MKPDAVCKAALLNNHRFHPEEYNVLWGSLIHAKRLSALQNVRKQVHQCDIFLDADKVKHVLTHQLIHRI